MQGGLHLALLYNCAAFRYRCQLRAAYLVYIRQPLDECQALISQDGLEGGFQDLVMDTAGESLELGQGDDLWPVSGRSV
jgi:hypothetical protein